MKKFALALVVALLPGCSLLGAMGIGASDVLPSLKYCDTVQYARAGMDMEIRATCKVPAG